MVARAVETDEPDAVLCGGDESRDPVVTDGRTENKIECADSIEGDAASHSMATVEAINIEERPTLDESQQSLQQVGVSDREIDVPLSRRIHILGFSAHARFLAHAVASVPDVPISMLAHHPMVMRRWGQENRMLSLFDGRGKHISSTAIPCPENIRYLQQYNKVINYADYYLDNVIVDTTETAVFPSLQALRDRIDHRTTICLLHPGLGLVEHLNEWVFTDPDERPNFVLGHSTHRVGKSSRGIYSMRHKQPGTLYLYGVPKPGGSTLDTSSIAYEAMRQTQNLAQLLSSTETLNVVGLHWKQFLSWKLPRLVFGSIADSISVILGCKYKDIYSNLHAGALWEDLMDETVAIISQLPEFQEDPRRLQYFGGKGLWRRLRTSLSGQGNNISPWIKLVRMGQCPPVDYFNGYIIQRAQELGLEHKHNSMASEAVKARVIARRQELRRDLLPTTPYMTDADVLGGGQPPPTPAEILELELEHF